MVSMKRAGGGLLLLLLLSMTLILTPSCGKESKTGNKQGEKSPFFTEKYRVDVIPSRSDVSSFSFSLPSILKTNSLVIPVKKKIKFKVDYKSNFGFGYKICIPGTVYSESGKGEVNQWIEISAPEWELEIQIFPKNQFPPIRFKYNFLLKDEVEFTYPYPEVLTGEIKNNSENFSLKNYRVQLKTDDGFFSSSAPVEENGKFELYFSPWEKYSEVIFFDSDTPFFPVFSIPLKGISAFNFVNFILSGKGRKDLLYFNMEMEEEFPYFISMKGESNFSISVSSTSTRGIVDNSVMMNGTGEILSFYSGNYNIFVIPSSVSGYASWITSIGEPYPSQMNVKFPKPATVCIVVHAPGGEALKGATVDIEPYPLANNFPYLPYSVITGEEGKAELPLLGSSPYMYYLVRALPEQNYEGTGVIRLINSVSLNNFSRRNECLDINLPDYTLQNCRIEDSNGKPVKKASILLIDEEWNLAVFRGTTNSRGEVAIPLPSK